MVLFRHLGMSLIKILPTGNAQAAKFFFHVLRHAMTGKIVCQTQFVMFLK
jgi:hypothetical protein